LAYCPHAVLLHCITAYPAPESQYNLRLLASLRSVFGRPVGVSDHSLDPLLVPALSVAVGGCLVEKHLTLVRAGGGLDDPIALEPPVFAEMVRGIRELERAGPEQALAALEGRYGRERVREILGDGVKRLAPAEVPFYTTSRRSLHALSEIEAGERITPERLCIVRSERNLRPGLGPEYLEAISGAVASRRIHAGEGIGWEDLITRA
jgi:sialic acid synthase SpsE